MPADVAGLVLATDSECGPPGSGLDAMCPLAGVPLIAYPVRTLRCSDAVHAVVVSAPAGSAGRIRRVLDQHVPGHRAVIVDGGDPAASIRACGAAEVVAVADFRRPLAPPELLDRVVGAVRRGADVAAPAVEVTETVKELDPGGWIARTLTRETLAQVQSPWAFRRTLMSHLTAATRSAAHADLRVGPLAVGWPPGTDVVTVAGHPDAFVVGTPADLELAAAVLRGRRSSPDGPAVVAPGR